MSKKNSKWGKLVEGLKSKLGSLTKKSSKKEDEEELYLDEEHSEDQDFSQGEEEGLDEDYTQEFDDEASLSELDSDEEFSAEEDEFDESTMPSFTPLTIDEIKNQQRLEGDIPPDFPTEEQHFNDTFDEETASYELPEEDDLNKTSLHIKEFETNHGTGFKGKILNKINSFKQSLNSHSAGANSTESGQKFSLESIKYALSSINVDGIFDKFFSPNNRPFIHRLFIALLTISSAYMTGKVITGIISPLPTTKSTASSVPYGISRQSEIRNEINKITQNDLFQAPEESDKPIIKDVPKKPDFVEVPICYEAKAESKLGLKLVNTVILQDSVKSLASVQIRGKDSYLRVGDQIPNMIEVGNIESRKIVFKNLKTRKCEYIEAPKDKSKVKPLNIIRDKKEGKKVIAKAQYSGITSNGNQFKIKKAVREKMLENISEVLTQARAVQIKNPDGSLAFRMQEIVPGSIYSQLDIQEGDTITGINGKKITNMAELMSLFGQIDKIDHFELRLKRNGIEQDLEYDFD